MRKVFSSSSILRLWIIIIIASNIYFRVIGNRMMGTITWDKFGYYLYLPAFFYDDPAQLKNFNYLVHNYNTGAEYQAMKAPNGNYIMKYSCGTAVMYLPGFLIGHVTAKIFNQPVDGLSFPYQAAVNFESLLVAILGMWLLRKILKKYFSDGVVALVIFIIGFASNYFQYAAYETLFQHVYLFTLYCIIMLLSIRWNQQPRYLTMVFLGLSCGLAALTRPTEIVTALIPFLWGVHDRSTLKQKFVLLKKNFGMIIAFGFAAFLVGSIQLIYWKIYAGEWVYYSYGGDQTFHWLKPHVREVLLSYKKGWITYTPVMILSLFGFITLYKKRREFFWFVIIFMLLYFYPVAAWDNWWYGGSFSMRAMIQSYPVLSFSLASFVEVCFSGLISSIIVVVFVAGCTWLNAVFSYQVFFSKQGIFDGETMTGRYYWRIFGRTHISINDKKLMDTYEELPSSLEKKLTPIYSNNIETLSEGIDTTTVFSGKHSLILNSAIQSTPVISIPIDGNIKNWFRVHAEVFASAMEWNVWQQAKVRAELWNNDTLVRERSIRIYRLIETGKWQHVFIDLDGCVNKRYNLLKVYFTNEGGSNTIFIDDIKVETVPAE